MFFTNLTSLEDHYILILTLVPSMKMFVVGQYSTFAWFWRC